MPVFEFNDETMPTPEEFARMLQEASEQYDPIEELLRLDRELAQIEQKYDMSSAEFFRQYQAGLMGDAIEIIEWAGRYRLYKRLKQTISGSLDKVVTPKAVVPA